MMDFESFEYVGKLLSESRWIFAKTMPQNPHFYTLRKEWKDSHFVAVVELMRRYGYQEKFAGRNYTQFNVNGYKYWTMGSPIDQTILINRKPVTADNATSPYDAVAQVYDSLFTDRDSVWENEQIFSELLPFEDGDSVLDIGCGSGLLLDYLAPHVSRYVGVDPSKGMLNQLLAKHPDYESSVITTRYEDYCSLGKRFDLIVSLFGSANYIEPEAFERIPRLLASSGRYFVMFYKPDYSPILYSRSGHRLQHYTYQQPPIAGKVTEFSNFWIVEGGNE